MTEQATNTHALGCVCKGENYCPHGYRTVVTPYLLGQRGDGNGTWSAALFSNSGRVLWACDHGHMDHRETLRCAGQERERRKAIGDLGPVRRECRPVLYVNASDDKYPDMRTGSAWVQRIEDDAIDEGLGL